MVLNTDKVAQFVENHFSKIFSMVIHEEVHLCAYNKYSDAKEETVSGVMRKTSHGTYVGPNEALTEMITYTVQDEYRKRSGDSTFSPNSYVYGDAISVLGNIAYEISQKTNVPIDTVMEAFVQAYFTGFDLSSADFFGQLDEGLQHSLKMFGRAIYL